MRATMALALLALSLLVAETSAIRLFDHKHPLKREIGRPRQGGDGKFRRKEVDVEHLGRAVFDPKYAHEEDLTHEDLGLEDLHDPTDHVIEDRLAQLFPTIDNNHDGMISCDELQRHLFLNSMAMSRRHANAEFADIDTNHDGKVTATEYLATMPDKQDEDKEEAVDMGAFPDPLDYSSYKDVIRGAIVYADQDHDGGLNRDEFFDFFHPEEGNNVNLKLHRLRQDIYEYLADYSDTSKPTQLELTFNQFYKILWSQFTVWDSHTDSENWTEDKEKQSAQRMFVLLDRNADNLLMPEELLPVFADLHPTENRYARLQAEHMMDMAECKDDQLTLEQMLKVPHAFYGVVVDEEDHSEL